jgi:hypothetical protein
MNSLRRETVLEKRLIQVMTALGFASGPDLQKGRSDRAWWFFRNNAELLLTEMIGFLYRLRPYPRITVELYVSHLRPHALARKGISGHVLGGANLFYFQSMVMNLEPGILLPAEIPLSDPMDEVLSKLAEEIGRVDAVIWPELVRP